MPLTEVANIAPQPQPSKEQATIGDYFDQFNITKMIYNGDKDNYKKEDSNFRLNEYINNIKNNVSDTERDYLVSHTPTSERQANNLLTTYREDVKTYQEMGNNGLLKNLAYGGAAMVFDVPTLLSEGTLLLPKAALVANTYKEVRNLKLAMEAARAGQETALLGVQEATGHYGAEHPNNILYAAALGGTLSGVIKGASNALSGSSTLQSSMFLKGTNRPADITNTLDTHLVDRVTGEVYQPSNAVDITMNGLPTSTELADMAHTTTSGSFILDKALGFLNSNGVISVASKDKYLSNISKILQTPKFNLYNKETGEVEINPLSAEDTVAQLDGNAYTLFTFLRNTHHDLKKEGYTGSYDTFVNDVWKHGVYTKTAIDDAVYGSKEFSYLMETWKQKQPYIITKAEEAKQTYISEGKQVLKDAKQSLLSNNEVIPNVSETLSTIADKIKANRNMTKPFVGTGKDITFADGMTASDFEYLSEVVGINRDQLLNFLSNKKTSAELKTQLMSEINTTLAPLRREISKGAEKVKQDFIETAGMEHRTQLDELFKKYTDAHFQNSPHNFDTALKQINKYFQHNLGLGKELKVPEFMHLLSNRMYFTRKFNYDAIDTLDHNVLVNRLYEAIINDPYTKRFGDLSKAREMAREMADDLKTRAFDRKMSDHNMFVPKTITTSSNFMSRQYHIDDSKLLDLLDTNAEMNINGYGYWNHKQFALRNSFKELQGVATEDLSKVFKEQISSKIDKNLATPREIDAVNNLFHDVMGTLKNGTDHKSWMWGASKAISGYNSAIMLANTGSIALTEIATALWATGMKKMFFKEFIPSIIQSTKFMISGGKHNNPMMDAALTAGNLIDTVSIHRGSEEFLGPMNKIDQALHKFLGVMYVGNMLRGITAGLEVSIFSNMVGELANIELRTMSKQDVFRYARYGLEEKDILAIQHQLQTYSTKDIMGNISNPNLHMWDETTRMKFQVASRRAVENGVIQGHTKDLPNAIRTAGPLGKLLFQFLRVPLAAQNSLLRRGLDNDKIGLLATTIGSMSIYMAIKLLSDQASAHINGTDPKYDIHDEESMTKLLYHSANYGTALGMSTDLASRLASFAGYSTDKYVDTGKVSKQEWLVGQTPTTSTIEKLHKTIVDAQQRGITDTKTLKEIKQLTVGNNLMIWSDFLNKKIEDYGD